jgi:hypothetical protein
MIKDLLTDFLAKNVIKSFDDPLKNAIAILTTSAFNQKGQELEEIIGYLLSEYAYNNGKITSIKVNKSKSLPDIVFDYNDCNGTNTYTFDVKFYGGSNRHQLSTLSDQLDNLKNTFQSFGTPPIILNDNQKDQIISVVNSSDTHYTLNFYYKTKKIRNTSDIEIECIVFGFSSLDLSELKTKNWNLMTRGTSQYLSLQIPIHSDVYFEISVGGNAYNRGIWLNKINVDKFNDMLTNQWFSHLHIIHNPVKIILSSYDPQDYLVERTKNIIKLNQSYFT